MLSWILNYIDLINTQVFLASMVLFFVGYAFAPMVYVSKISLLLAYPMWVSGKLESWTKQRWNPYLLFLFLLAVNSFSLTVNFLSGLIPFLPLVFAIWMGLNIGIITFHTLKGKFYYAALLNPVALFELPAAFISFTLAMQYNLVFLEWAWFKVSTQPVPDYSTLFAITVFPLLLIAAIIETILIVYSQKLEDKFPPEA